MKTFKGILYGIAIAIAVSAGAATVYNYFPPPGMTYSPTTGFVVGSATGGAQGAGTVNAQGVFVNGAAVVTGAGLPVGANPTGTVGLTAVNGSAATFLRSDGAPPLSQAISPTWTGVHTFSFSGIAVDINSANPRQRYFVTGATANQGVSLFVPSSTGIEFDSATDAAPTAAVTSLWKGVRTGAAWSSLQLGNATDNTAFTFQGTGAFSVGGGITVGSPTGGNQGTGSINMQSCFVNGVACSTGGAAGANPTGTVGLAVVNGVAGTYMRSDAAPPLSQAIAPTWSAAHIFAKNASSPPSFGQSISVSAATGGVAATFYGTSTTAAGFNIDFYDTTNALGRGFIGFGSSTITGAAITDFGIAPGTSGRVVIGTPNGAAIGAIFDSTGSLQVPFIGIGRTPSSGITKLVADNGGSGDTELVAQTTTAGNAQIRTVNLGGTNWSFGNLRSDGSFDVCNASTLSTGCALSLLSSQHSAYFNTASSTFSTANRGVIALNGVTDSLIDLQVNGTATGYLYVTSGSIRLQGTTSTLIDFYPGNTQRWSMGASGGFYASGSSLTDQGAGTVNSTQLYQSGNPVYREVSWAGTCTSGGCTTGISKGTGSVTRNSAGNYTVPFSANFGGNAGCTATTWSTLNNGAISTNVSTANTSSVNVVVINSSGTAVDSGFTVVCIG